MKHELNQLGLIVLITIGLFTVLWAVLLIQDLFKRK